MMGCALLAARTDAYGRGTTGEQRSRKEERYHHALHRAQVKTSMLAMGACERIRKLSKAHPHEVCTSPILPEMIKILEDGPLMPLAGAVLAALATLALNPEGRQCIVLLGGAPPLVK